MARISVVVPIYNVEPYLRECLDSIARQTYRDLEIVMVDDGSTDGGPAIAGEFARDDPRFRLLSQANQGLGAARNTGIDDARGEFLAFVDSDDVLPGDALERLIGALDRTGSDFATGNVHRLSMAGTRQARFLSHAFTRTVMETHITRRRALITDRTVWNKLWRRSFWDAQGYRFATGVFNEDIPIVIPAHFSARSVDVIAEPVYLWRSRESGDRSITQRRREPRALNDRLSAIEQVLAFLDASQGPEARRWYEESIFGSDLRYHLGVLEFADDEYRTMFLDRVGALLEAADPRSLDALPALERRQWQLVRERRMPELIEALRDQRDSPTLRVRLTRAIPERHRRRLRGVIDSLRPAARRG
jgi:CDP-glycerol glycerophosphotransferase